MFLGTLTFIAPRSADIEKGVPGSVGGFWRIALFCSIRTAYFYYCFCIYYLACTIVTVLLAFLVLRKSILLSSFPSLSKHLLLISLTEHLIYISSYKLTDLLL